MIKRLLLTALVGALTLAGCSGQTTAPVASARRAAPVPPQARTIYMAAVEFKSSTTVDRNPFPAEALPEGKGYELIAPDASGTWVVETYHLDPGTIVVYQGDTVTLEVIGINGKEHPISVEGYNVSGTVKRGQVTRLSFTADKAGVFKISCGVHAPTMQASLVVLPNE